MDTKIPATRYTLTRSWGDDSIEGPLACWIMFNPSSADDTQNDPTIRQCIKHSKRLGFRSLVVVNLWPFRTAHPKELREFLVAPIDLYDELRENEVIVDDEARRADTVIAAWGNEGWFSPPWVNDLAVDIGQPLYCLGTNTNGSPKHPLARAKHRIPDDQPLEVWRAV